LEFIPSNHVVSKEQQKWYMGAVVRWLPSYIMVLEIVEGCVKQFLCPA